MSDAGFITSLGTCTLKDAQHFTDENQPPNAVSISLCELLIWNWAWNRILNGPSVAEVEEGDEEEERRRWGEDGPLWITCCCGKWDSLTRRKLSFIGIPTDISRGNCFYFAIDINIDCLHPLFGLGNCTSNIVILPFPYLSHLHLIKHIQYTAENGAPLTGTTFVSHHLISKANLSVIYSIADFVADRCRAQVDRHNMVAR